MAKNFRSNIYEGGLTVDPSAGAGVPAPIGALVARIGTPQLWQKIGAGDTEWEEVIQAYPNPANFTTWFDDFLSSAISTTSLVGGGTGTYAMALGANNPGTVSHTVAAAGVDGVNTHSNPDTFFWGGGRTTFENVHSIVTLSNGVNDIVVRIGSHDGAAGDVTDGVYLEYDLATHGSQNYFLCAANNLVRTKVDTGIAAVAGGIRKVIITVNAAGTLASATIDGVASAGTVATNIPTTAARRTFIARVQTLKTLGAVGRNVLYDYYRFSQDLTPAR